MSQFLQKWEILGLNVASSVFSLWTSEVFEILKKYIFKTLVGASTLPYIETQTINLFRSIFPSIDFDMILDVIVPLVSFLWKINKKYI